MNIKIKEIIPKYTRLFRVDDNVEVDRRFEYLNIEYVLIIGENIFLQGTYRYTDESDYEKLNIDDFKKNIENEILKEFKMINKER